jgi:hypothetical protein
MKLAILGAILALAASPARADDREELGKAVDQAEAAESYAFTIEFSFDAPFAQNANQIPTLEGKFQKDVGTHVEIGDRAEVFRKGDKVFARQGEGEWQDAGRFRPTGGDPGQGQRRAAFARMMIRDFKAPHEDLGALVKGLEKVGREEKKEKVGDRECTVYLGDLTEEALKASLAGQMIKRFGGDRAEGVNLTGEGVAWVDGDGNVLKYEATTFVSGEFQGQSFEISFSRTCEIKDVGRAKVEVPEGMRKLLDTPSVDEMKPAEDGDEDP